MNLCIKAFLPIKIISFPSFMASVDKCDCILGTHTLCLNLRCFSTFIIRSYYICWYQIYVLCVYTSFSDLSRGGQQLAQFSKEILDLLKAAPYCRMAFSKFIPCYHQHFGRQCRVAEYGYSRLQEVFEAIPHVLQVNLTHLIQTADCFCSVNWLSNTN